MKKTILVSMMLCFVVAACRGQKIVPAVLPSTRPLPGPTSTPAIFSTPTRIQPTEIPVTSTLTRFSPYHTKEVVFDYYVTGNQADFDVFFDPPSGNIITRLVLYDDGQMLIAGPGETYKQKVLSAGEIKSFLSKLETAGFYSLESNQNHDPTDRLYNFEGRYEEVEVMDGLKYCILVNADRSRDLCVNDAYTQFLIPAMKNILHYLDNYKPAGMTPYYPERILLTIQAADPSVENSPATPWNGHFPSLETGPNRFTSDTSSQILYIEGDMAKEIYLFFEGTDGWKLVSQNGKEYIVSFRGLLPNEKVKNPT